MPAVRWTPLRAWKDDNWADDNDRGVRNCVTSLGDQIDMQLVMMKTMCILIYSDIDETSHLDH